MRRTTTGGAAPAWLVAAVAALLPLASTAQPAPGADAAPGLLHPMFSDHGVLQRDRPIRVYGIAPAG